MVLYEMLDKAKYYQKVWIFKTNAYDQNMPIFKGDVDGARKDADKTWDFLMCKVTVYYCTFGILVIFVEDENYENRLENEYSNSDRWGKERSQRPWLYTVEIEEDMKKAKGRE